MLQKKKNTLLHTAVIAFSFKYPTNIGITIATPTVVIGDGGVKIYKIPLGRLCQGGFIHCFDTCSGVRTTRH